MTKNLTTGNPARLILSFTIPLLIGNLFQQFYNMADTLIVGRTIGVDAVAAVGSTGSISFLILGFAMGVTSGMAIVTAQRYGAGDYAGVRRSFAVSLLLSLAITVVLTLASVLAARPFLELLRTPADIFEDAHAYIVIIFWGIGAAMLFNLFSNVMRAVGDSRSPLVFLVIACVVNIVLDYVLIIFFDMGVAGAAVATVIAQGLSAALCFLYICKKMPVLRLRKRDFRLTADDFKAHLRLGLPMGFQASIIAIGALVLQFAINGLGKGAVAAITAAQKIESLGTMPLMSFGVTMATFTAQNYGAGAYHRIRKGVIQCAIISVSFSFFMALVNIFAGDRLASMFVGSNAVITQQAHEYLVINGACYFILALLFIFRYSLQGLGKSFVPTLAGIMELIMRSFAGMFLTYAMGFTGACLAGPLAWLGAGVPLGIAFYLNMRRLLLYPPAPQEAVEEPLQGDCECRCPQ